MLWPKATYLLAAGPAPTHQRGRPRQDARERALMGQLGQLQGLGDWELGGLPSLEHPTLEAKWEAGAGPGFLSSPLWGGRRLHPPRDAKMFCSAQRVIFFQR